MRRSINHILSLQQNIFGLRLDRINKISLEPRLMELTMPRNQTMVVALFHCHMMRRTQKEMRLTVLRRRVTEKVERLSSNQTTSNTSSRVQFHLLQELSVSITNAITKNANSFNSAFGAAAANAGRYRADGNGPYFIKSKTQQPQCQNRVMHLMHSPCAG